MDQLWHDLGASITSSASSIVSTLVLTALALAVGYGIFKAVAASVRFLGIRVIGGTANALGSAINWVAVHRLPRAGALLMAGFTGIGAAFPTAKSLWGLESSLMTSGEMTAFSIAGGVLGLSIASVCCAGGSLLPLSKIRAREMLEDTQQAENLNVSGLRTSDESSGSRWSAMNGPEKKSAQT